MLLKNYNHVYFVIVEYKQSPFVEEVKWRTDLNNKTQLFR